MSASEKLADDRDRLELAQSEMAASGP